MKKKLLVLLLSLASLTLVSCEGGNDVASIRATVNAYFHIFKSDLIKNTTKSGFSYIKNYMT